MYFIMDFVFIVSFQLSFYVKMFTMCGEVCANAVKKSLIMQLYVECHP